MAGKTGTAQVRRITQGRTRSRRRRQQRMRSCPGNCATMRCSSPSRRWGSRAMPLSIILEHWQRSASHPHVQMVRDILLFAQQRRSAKLPTAYPVKCGRPRRNAEGGEADEHPSLCRRPSATLSLGDKMLEINWGFVLLIGVIAMHRLRDALFGGGRQFHAVVGAADRALRDRVGPSRRRGAGRYPRAG